MKFIIIDEWQKWLGSWMGQFGPHPEYVQVSHRHFRYGNAQNVKVFTPSLANALSNFNCKFHVVEEDN